MRAGSLPTTSLFMLLYKLHNYDLSRLAVGYTDGKVMFSSKTRLIDPDIASFFYITDRLPIELNMRICNLVFNINKEFIYDWELSNLINYSGWIL